MLSPCIRSFTLLASFKDGETFGAFEEYEKYIKQSVKTTESQQVEKKKTKKVKKKKTPVVDESYKQEELPFESGNESGSAVHDIHVTVNNKPVTLSGKSSYVFVDIFDKIDFDLKTVGGTRLVQNINGTKANYFGPITDGAVIDLYWEQ